MLQNSELNANSPLPTEKMPDCWNQDNRMNALFSPFRSKSANQQDWISKYKFWNNLIYVWLKHTMQCSFSIFDLNEIFKRKGCSPLCLTTVTQEMLRNREIVLEEEFLKEPSDSWTTWSLDVFIKKPLTWSYYKMKDYVIGQNIDINTRYVHLKAVKEIAEQILSTIVNENDNILISITEILEKCKKEETYSDISENTLKLALIWLKHHKKAVLKKSSINNELLVKFSTQTIYEISEIDETLYKLLNQESKFEREIELLEKEKIIIMDKVKTCLAKELKQVAKTHLRKKNEIEKTIEKRAQILGNLRALILSIQDTHSNSSAVDAFKLGSNVLSQFEEKGLTEYKVRDVMDDLNEALENYKDVQSTLSEILPNADFESDSDLEKELSELMNNDDVLESTSNINNKEELDDIEERLRNLGVAGLPSPQKSLKTSTPIQKKKVLVQAENM
ncbi:charged multivesicular body protein 7-like [Vespa mandarinia]|uniref:charged multivesicular body protein 7-like n=1 Tax=Vespa mandarinia TaxID=7446 RepID=UPI0016129569|nr:charged multivesicular body protein 7-like [Vespa mandarinia]XP_035719949.1 charged multivesicular body protein 7-like [Vespa mandarinia]XP_035719957.1 charged multivesicular body protein 7-like [Vespa mandarinia]